MRHIIIGTGAVGGVVGGLLAGAGKDVVLVARGRQLEALRAGRARGHDGRRDRARAPTGRRGTAGRRPAPRRRARPGREEPGHRRRARAPGRTAPWPAAGPRPSGSPSSARRTAWTTSGRRCAGSPRVVAMCVWLPATYLEPGRVSAGGTPVPGVLTDRSGGPVVGRRTTCSPPYAGDLDGRGLPRTRDRRRDGVEVPQAAVQPGERRRGALRHHARRRRRRAGRPGRGRGPRGPAAPPGSPCSTRPCTTPRAPTSR